MSRTEQPLIVNVFRPTHKPQCSKQIQQMEKDSSPARIYAGDSSVLDRSLGNHHCPEEETLMGI